MAGTAARNGNRHEACLARRDEATSWHRRRAAESSSGNAAFDEYKAETLKRLEDEQAEFSDFLTNLRKARDKAEFDQFMQSRRAPRETPAEPAPRTDTGVTPDNY